MCEARAIGTIIPRSVPRVRGNTECCDDTMVCKNVLELGETGCSSADHTKCKDGNEYVEDKCVIVVAFGSTDCNLDNYVCETRTKCDGQTCVRRVLVGQSCADENVLCKGYLVCESEVCKIYETDSCNWEGGGGVGRFCCLEPHENQRCTTLRKPGASCGLTNFDVSHVKRTVRRCFSAKRVQDRRTQLVRG